ncbi:MAG: Glu-tRNA(Gln) amidotransferase subunit GatD [Candidatus Woesearchaeota archaeon]
MKPGDIVSIQTSTLTYTGTVLPRSSLFDQDIVVLKLENGYNVGIKQSTITSVTQHATYEPQQKKKQDIPHNPNLPTVALLSFGGTISSRLDYITGGVVADYDAQDFLAMCPELKNVANIQATKVAQLMSEDMDSDDWMSMAKTIIPYLNNKDIAGVVITTGTDTLHYIAAALSFMLGEVSKPVVMTASQRSIDRGSSDAFMNLSCAVTTAARWDGAGVVTCLHATTHDNYCQLIAGTKVRKMHTSRRDAFRPINSIPFAHVSNDGVITPLQTYPKRHDKQCEAATYFEKKTALVFVHPGMDPGIITYYQRNGYKGIVLAATALGHVPTIKNSLFPAIEQAIQAGVVVVIASQTLYGAVHPYVYANLRLLSMQTGCVFVHDMLPETAYVKLGWLLGQKRSDIKEQLTQNTSAEITTHITDAMYMN